jgi:hypothetical protein
VADTGTDSVVCYADQRTNSKRTVKNLRLMCVDLAARVHVWRVDLEEAGRQTCRVNLNRVVLATNFVDRITMAERNWCSLARRFKSRSMYGKI